MRIFQVGKVYKALVSQYAVITYICPCQVRQSNMRKVTGRAGSRPSRAFDRAKMDRLLSEWVLEIAIMNIDVNS